MFKLKPAFFVLPICVICFLISVISSYASEESLTITTYYPSPYGSYRELRSQRIAIGDTYINGGQYCWEGESGCTGTGGQNMIPSATDLVVQGNVGIGTVNPGSKLVIAGDNVNTDRILIGDTAPMSIGELRTDFGNSRMIEASSGLGFRAAGVSSYHMFINPSGNVGIGTTNPGAKLEVEGGIKAGTGGNKGGVIHQPCIVVSSSGQAIPGANGIYVACPAGTQATGGGGSCANQTAMLHLSELKNNGWWAYCQGPGGEGMWTTAEAVCCRVD